MSGSVQIAQPSVQSLYIELQKGDDCLSIGTAFLATSPKGPVLITNRHNFTGKHQDTDNCLSRTGGFPDQVKIYHNKEHCLGSWVPRTELLYTENLSPRWVEHPNFGKLVDFVALPLTETQGIEIFPYDLEDQGLKLAFAVSERISVVGFPFGIRVGGSMAVWATGFIASEPQIDYNKLPCFLIDCRSRQGQSGSPVIAHTNGGSLALDGSQVLVHAGSATRLFGVYSGRINEESDLGVVWKTSAIRELVESI